MICGAEVREPKPAPDGLLLACRRLGVAAAATAYVGDAEVDLHCARTAGATAVHARWGAAAAIADFPLVAHLPHQVAELLRVRA